MHPIKQEKRYKINHSFWYGLVHLMSEFS